MQRERMYFCIDMKSFFARWRPSGVKSFQTNLVVANPKVEGAICLRLPQDQSRSA